MNGDETEKRTTETVQPSDPAIQNIAPQMKVAPNQAQPPAQSPVDSAPESPWQYRSSAPSQPAPAATFNQQSGTQVYDGPSEVTWSASEFIAHNKGIGWFVALAAVTVAIDIALYLLIKDVLTAVVVPVFAILFGITAARKPRVMEYRLNGVGLYIGSRFYPYGEFKSFSIQEDGAFASIVFSPLKRFMPPTSIYFGPDDEDKIFAVLSQHLPMEHLEHDFVDRLSRRIRF
jgi:hypothetical protein